MKTYKAKNTGFIYILIVILMALPIIVFNLDSNTFTEKPWLLLPLSSPLVIILWVYFGTVYKIENGQLAYKSGFLKGQIDISSIREITKGGTMWAGRKPALASNGLIIKYNRHDEIYIAPIDNNEVLGDLLKINPEIHVL